MQFKLIRIAEDYARAFGQLSKFNIIMSLSVRNNEFIEDQTANIKRTRF